MKAADLTGQRFERLTVIERVENDKHGCAMWLCKCDCGKEITTTTTHLRRGDVKSCGCYSRDCTRKRNKTQVTHGLSKTRLYKLWGSMQQRCNNPEHKSYSDYGGRGIAICNEWSNREAFFKWAIANGYADNLTIDRIDVNADYSPDNCRFITTKEQIRNRRNTVKVPYRGSMVTLAELAEISGVPYATIHWRYRRGYSSEEMIKPVRKYKKER